MNHSSRPAEPEEMSPFRSRLESAAVRLEVLRSRSSPTVAMDILREIVAVREAATRLEGEPCHACATLASAKCRWCAGKGAL